MTRAIVLMMLSGGSYAQLPSTNDTSDGFGNTGMGTGALIDVAPSTGFNGTNNTAAGYNALDGNTIGHDNAAFGSWAMADNTTGADNTAVGSGALLRNTTGSNNTAIGNVALYRNTTGGNNTATGIVALGNNTTGGQNTATGEQALLWNMTGDENTASGFQSLFYNVDGSRNTASGAFSLERNTSGIHNSAFGANALSSNTTGSDNIAVGFHAGYGLATGSNNIEIGNPGDAADGNTANSGVIRIGTQTPVALQTNTYIAGIYDNTSVSGLAVIIDANGQLGTVKSAERYKTAIAPMGSSTERLRELRPVTFRYKNDAQGTLRYGLVAEEVANLFPELVIRDGQGRADGLRYDELAPMLLNEMQREQAAIAAQDQKIASLERQLAGMQAALAGLKPSDERAAGR
jgi:hypothetical protein